MSDLIRSGEGVVETFSLSAELLLTPTAPVSDSLYLHSIEYLFSPCTKSSSVSELLFMAKQILVCVNCPSIIRKKSKIKLYLYLVFICR